MCNKYYRQQQAQSKVQDSAKVEEKRIEEATALNCILSRPVQAPSRTPPHSLLQ
jgi:hypothetical protein